MFERLRAGIEKLEREHIDSARTALDIDELALAATHDDIALELRALLADVARDSNVAGKKSQLKTCALTSGRLMPEGLTYRTWLLTKEQHDAITEALGEPDVERFQTVAEADASKRLVESNETPPIKR